MSLAKAVKILLIENDMTSLELAKETGLSRDGIYKAVNCSRRLDGLKKIAIGLNVSLSSLIAKSEELE